MNCVKAQRRSKIDAMAYQSKCLMLSYKVWNVFANFWTPPQKSVQTEASFLRRETNHKKCQSCKEKNAMGFSRHSIDLWTFLAKWPPLMGTKRSKKSLFLDMQCHKKWRKKCLASVISEYSSRIIFSTGLKKWGWRKKSFFLNFLIGLLLFSP